MQIDVFLQAVKDKKARLYHAVQLRDLRTYVRAGYIVPREELFDMGVVAYTPFSSDRADVEWMHCGSDCFGNLVDQGQYSRNGNALPNVYGPITLVFMPDALQRVGSNEINIRKGAIFSANEEGRRPLQTSDEVREIYDVSGYAKSGEFQIVHSALRLEDIAYVIVNPIERNGVKLADAVSGALGPIGEARGRAIPVVERKFGGKGAERYADLVSWAASAPQHGGDKDALPNKLTPWFNGLSDLRKDANLARFANYLYHGTLSALEGRIGHLRPAEQIEEPEDFDYGSQWLERIFELGSDEIYERDLALSEVAMAEIALDEAAGIEDDEERGEALAAAWGDYEEALTNLNYWIENTRRRIENDRDEMHSVYMGSHDSDASAGMTAWADEYQEIEIPTFDPTSAHHVRANWRKVEEYPEFSLHL